MKYLSLVIIAILLVSCSENDNEARRNNSMNKETPVEMSAMTEEQRRIVEKLSLIDIDNIDKGLLKETPIYRRKTAMVIAMAMSTMKKIYPDIPIQFYLDRLIKLVNGGKLKVYGNIKFIRFSEIKLITA